jgi:hypothetical protein
MSIEVFVTLEGKAAADYYDSDLIHWEVSLCLLQKNDLSLITYTSPTILRIRLIIRRGRKY